MSSFDYQKSTITKYRAGTSTDPYIDITEEKKVINYVIQLNEIPVFLNKVRIDSMYEVPSTYTNDLKANEFRVNYTEGIVHFHPSIEGETLTLVYKGRGNHFVSAARIWTKEQDGQVLQTLDSLVDAGYESLENIKVLESVIKETNHAKDNANDAASRANAAATDVKVQGDYARAQGDYAKEQANYAKTQGDYASQSGDEAKNQGDYAKTQGDFALEQGNIASSKANDAESAASSAIDAANIANEATILANQATINAEISTKGANLARDSALQQSSYAESQGDYAKEQGNYAKTQGDYAKTQAEEALNAALEASDASLNAKQATTEAIQATILADSAADTARDSADYARTQGDYAKAQGDYATKQTDIIIEKGTSIINRGVWNNTSVYKPLNIVVYDSKVFQCLQENMDVEPSLINGAYWQLLLEQTASVTWDSIAGKPNVEGHIVDTNNPHNVTAAQINAYDKNEIDFAMDLKENIVNKGKPGGYASLDVNGFIPESQLNLPSNIVIRDADGQFKAGVPTEDDHVARKVDLDEVKQSVSDGKAKVAAAITDKGVPTAATDPLQIMADNIGDIVLGSGDAQPGDVLKGKTFSNDSGPGKVGTIPNHGAGGSVTPGTTNQSKEAGYYSSPITIKGEPNLVAENLPKDKSFFGVTGLLERMTTAEKQAIADAITGKGMVASVNDTNTVLAQKIEDIVPATGGTATVGDILRGKTATIGSGDYVRQVTGTLSPLTILSMSFLKDQEHTETIYQYNYNEILYVVFLLEDRICVIYPRYQRVIKDSILQLTFDKNGSRLRFHAVYKGNSGGVNVSVYIQTT